ncbi:SET and MYND domain-containing protein 4-like [Culex pipiens pallens]|uniref:SET and MYND domain-containing protein 4-like n=1 Tax=Culex pipiens pallens TaxID=42434 RepID=UPI001953FCCD|nr:SET and MYND domain-containing protein 4-like [Culex pipiens pallens]
MAMEAEIDEFVRNMEAGKEGPYDGIKWLFPPELEARRADLTEYRDVIDARFGSLVYISELVKKSKTAAECRQAGNQRFTVKRWHSALLNYNEGLCFAEPGSEELGLAYANRSAVYFEQGDYELALHNIDLAKRHNYPERLMAKLLDREAECKRKIENGQSKGIVPALRMGINVEVNPKIPFLAKGIGMKQYPGLGRGLIALKDFQPGDVILDEKPELCAVSFNNNFSYHYCFHCGSEFQTSLIPCPKCTNHMYCSESCLETDWKQAHRFECAVAMKLFNISLTSVSYGRLIGRLFFYGLTAFGDNVQQMMTWCEQNYDTGSDPLQIDFSTERDPLKIFKALHSTKVKPNAQFEHDFKLITACYYQIYLKSPQVQAIFRKRAHRNFMLRCLHHYALVTWTLQSDTPRPPGVSTISPITSLLNHSCDPNALTVIHSGRIVTVILRPVREGAQIFTSYGRRWWDPKLADYELSSFACQCVVCGNHPPGQKWRAALQRADVPKPILLEVSQIAKLVERPGLVDAAKMDAMKQFIKRHTRAYPLPALGEIVRLYAVFLEDAIQSENETRERLSVRAELLGD